MRCLSLRNPWPWTIFHRSADIINQTHVSHYLKPGDWLAIYGSLKPTGTHVYTFRDDLQAIKGRGFDIGGDEAEKIMPGILGAVKYVGAVRRSSSPWFFGPVGWIIDDRILFPAPIKIKCVAGLWQPTGDLLNQIMKLTKKTKEPL